MKTGYGALTTTSVTKLWGSDTYGNIGAGGSSYSSGASPIGV